MNELLDSLKSLPNVMRLEFEGKLFQKSYGHVWGQPSARGETQKMMTSLGIADPDFLSLYTNANGFTLFCSSSDNTDDGKYFIPPVCLHPIELIEMETSHFRQEFDGVPEEERPLFVDGIVIGEPTGTGNHFLLMREGPFANQIFYYDHDPDESGWNLRPFSSSLRELLAHMSTPPFRVISDLCGAERAWF